MATRAIIFLQPRYSTKPMFVRISDMLRLDRNLDIEISIYPVVILAI